MMFPSPSLGRKERKQNTKPLASTRTDESSSSGIIESEAARGFALILSLSLSRALRATGSTRSRRETRYYARQR